MKSAVALLGILAASTAVPQHPLPVYSAGQLHCTRWTESSRSELETATGRMSGQASTGRKGRWNLRARPAPAGVELEGWYDSLVVWRRAEESELRPDTDGVIGGRYRGLLDPRGSYTAAAKPFVPDEVAEVAELAGALADLCPPLPPTPLAPGQSWQGADIEIRRLADTVVAGGALWRFAVQRRSERDQTMPRGDTVPIPLRQTTTETGEFAWSPRSGLAWRSREIVVETFISAAGRVRQPVRSRLMQQVELTRLRGSGCS